MVQRNRGYELGGNSALAIRVQSNQATIADKTPNFS